MPLKKIISNEFRLESLTLLEEDDVKYISSLRIIREAHEKLGLGEDPLDILIRQEESDTSL